MRSFPIFRRLFRWLGGTLALAVVLAVAGFGLLQTQMGRDWAGRMVAGAISSPDFSVTVQGLAGTIPFDMRARRIEISDERGVWLTLNDIHLELAARELLAGRMHIRRLTAAELDIARPPDMRAATEPAPLSDLLQLPSLPFAATVDRFAIERIAIGTDILGEAAEATATGHAVAQGEDTEVTLDLHRIDGFPGNLALHLRQSGADPVLAVRLTASEPTGVLLGRWLDRTDRPALLISLTGEGPLADWRGRLDISAGQLARLAGDVTIAVDRETTLSVAGTAALAPLLPPDVAALTGDSVPVSAQASFRENGAISLDALSIELAAGSVSGAALIAQPDRRIAGQLRAAFPDLAAASALLGQSLHGSAELTTTLSGTEDQPRVQLELSGRAIDFAGSGVEHAEARLGVGWSGSVGDPAARVAITAGGEFRGLVMPQGVPRELGRDLDWSLSASAARDGSAVTLTEFTARGAGVDIAGAGDMAQYGQVLDGRIRLSVADLRPFTGMLGQPLAGSLTLDVHAQQQSGDRVVASLDGAITNFHIGLPGIDAVAGNAVAIAGAAERDPSGTWRLDRLTMTGSGSSLAASGSFDPTAQRLAATLDVAIASLQPVGVALDSALGGRITARIGIDGHLDNPRIEARIEGHDLTAATAVLDRVRLDAAIADPTRHRATITGDFRSAGLDGTVSLDIDASDPAVLAIRRMQVKAAGGIIGGDVHIDRANLLMDGTVTGKVPDLAPWSRLAGTPLAGKLDVTARFEARAGQSVNLTMTGDRLSSGAGDSAMRIGRIAATARLSDLFGTPAGTARATLTETTLPSGTLSTVTATLDSRSPGRFGFTVNASGTIVEPLTLAAEGTADIAPLASTIDLRIARLNGALGPDRFRLTRPLSLTKRGDDVALSGLALRVGTGQITGEAARRGAALSLRLSGRNLPIAAAGRLAGYRDVSGTAGLDVSVGGTIGAPQGRFTLSGRALRLALSEQQQLPSLALDLSGNWNGREVTLNGRVSGLRGEALQLSGSVPLVLTAAPLGIDLPPEGRLALRLYGAGEIGNLADLLPLGEDRFTGRFALDAAISGTPAAPIAGGHLRISDGRYENFATGAVLTRMQLDLAGDRDRLTVREFSAGDTADGGLAGRGSVILGSAGPTANLSLRLAGFRILGRNDAVVTASGTVAVTGAVASPNVTARLTTDRGDLTIPDSFPPSVVQLDVVEINSRTGKRGTSPEAAKTPPALPAVLDIDIAVPGRIFVRGRGLDSEWRGQLNITGTSAAPHIIGSLQVLRGSFDILGKTFRVVRGTIGFDGGTTTDPTLDLMAEVSAGDITAQILVSGPASSPNLTMTSSPTVPSDEILSRVLFNRGLGQITAAEGLQVAQAAATLAGGGLGVLDRLRGRLGLDRLVIGSTPAGVVSSNLNPAAGGGGPAISGGKYVADGVYVGATQGLTPDSSKVVIEIEVRPRVTIEGDFSQSGGSGIGLNYKYDY